MTLEDVRITSFHDYFPFLPSILKCPGIVWNTFFFSCAAEESLADQVSPPLVSPDHLEVGRKVASPWCCLCSGANHLQSAQQELCLGPDSNYGHCPSQEGSGQSQLSLLSPHLPPPPFLGVQPLSPLRWPSGGSGIEDPQTPLQIRQPPPPSPPPRIPVWSQLVQWCQAQCQNATGRCFWPF